MPEIWQQMTVEEKLDNLKGRIQRLNTSLALINDNLRQINQHLSEIENNIKQFGNAGGSRLDSDYPEWSEKP